MINILHIKFSDGAVLEPKLYRFLDGPFKGSLFLCTSPDVGLMNEHPWFEVEFISGPCKGIKTSSLITYDRKVISFGANMAQIIIDIPDHLVESFCGWFSNQGEQDLMEAHANGVWNEKQCSGKTLKLVLTVSGYGINEPIKIREYDKETDEEIQYP
ncbi:hypothetical protein CG98_gp124 [Enterobacter phage PG7]|uniref:Uncharacterized protein n=1 Tax=Enterobacter phage PG7 TaxID=1455074 RepID=W6ASH4_9CAUD|nr:hypothetical protein CG98_gp124 [Enterobacter phage PG7]AHI61027.1 hypothetical protein PG7_124 [Enterobacter phage PG7]